MLASRTVVFPGALNDNEPMNLPLLSRVAHTVHEYVS